MNINGREVVSVEIDGVDTRDYPDFSDAYFSFGIFKDNGEELNEIELEMLTNDYGDVVNEMAFESCL